MDFTKTIIPLALMGSESIAHEGKGNMINYNIIKPIKYRDLSTRGRERLRVRDLTQSFFCIFSKIDTPESFIVL